MIDFYNECISNTNLSMTILMVMVLLYWLMVIVGVLGLDTLDFDLDSDVGLDADFGVDTNVGVDASPNAVFGSGSSASGNEGILRAAFDFFYLGEVPVVIVGTFFVFYLWMATFITNHYFNSDQSMVVMLAWLIPNVLVSMISTRYTMIPFSLIFKKDGPENTAREEMIGRKGNVTTSEVTDRFGQMEIINTSQLEITLNIRTRPGTKLARGDTAKIISFNNSDGTFLVELTKWENNLDG